MIKELKKKIIQSIQIYTEELVRRKNELFFEIQLGGWKYLSFVVIDVISLFLSNIIASWFYIEKTVENYGFKNYYSIVFIMIVADLSVTFICNTLRWVLRRRKRKEIIESFKQVVFGFMLLCCALFSFKIGAFYSRFTVFAAYSIYFFLLVITHILWKMLLKSLDRAHEKPTVLLLSTDGFMETGVNELRKAGSEIKYISLLKNINKEEYKGVKILKDINNIASVICWELIDKFYIYGVDLKTIPANLKKACWNMGMKIDFVDFNYKIINVKTIKSEDYRYGALSFLEGKRDIPFPIRRVYWITETEANLHRGFHAHKLNCQLLFCPYGDIDIVIDDGKRKKTISLNKPEKGLLLMPGLWREMIWKKSGSVLCVLASEYYDAKEYIRDYDDFVNFKIKYDTDFLEVTHEEQDV